MDAPTKSLTLLRDPYDEEGTLGGLFMEDGRLLCHTIELPWRANKPYLSCIPEGEYLVIPWQSSRFGKAYHVVQVPGRSSILFHAGNWAGDSEKDLRTNSWGCILPGQGSGRLCLQKAVLNSRRAMNLLRNWAGQDDFTLKIKWRGGSGPTEAK